MEKKGIGDKIKQIRETKEIRIGELALRCNLEEKQIELIEEDKILPSLAPLIKIARSLGVSQQGVNKRKNAAIAKLRKMIAL